MSTIEINSQFKKALNIINAGQNLFITGRAGTGKSTFLQHLRQNSEEKIVVLAPTGVAAINVGGQTIHSFFGFKADVSPEKIYRERNPEKIRLFKKITKIVIDEISMVRADLLDCVDKFLRLNGPEPNHLFGGVQMIFIGDLYQLSPVVTSQERALFQSHYEGPYFFNSRACQQLDLEIIHLEKIYRQKDPTFINILNGIRSKTINYQDLSLLNQRYQPNFQHTPKDLYITLCCTNALAEKINQENLKQIKNKIWRHQAEIHGQVSKEYFPAPQKLELKKQAQVMLLNNDSQGRWVNGSIGQIQAFEKIDGEEVILVELENGKLVEVQPHTWEIFQFSLEENQIVSEITGSFTQYPLRPAFAITIHKSQGKTFEKVIIDIGRGTFAHGQIYVALSRCTSLEGLILKQRINQRHILIDPQIMQFLKSSAAQKLQIDPKFIDEKLLLITRAIREKQKLKITYTNTQNQKSIREISPQALKAIFKDAQKTLGLAAYCDLRQEMRTFKISQINKVEIIPAAATPAN